MEGHSNRKPGDKRCNPIKMCKTQEAFNEPHEVPKELLVDIEDSRPMLRMGTGVPETDCIPPGLTVNIL